jgi:hypothetical protein
MANNFLILGTVAGFFGWAFVSGPPPSTEPAAHSPAPHLAAAGSFKRASAAGPVLEARRAPVPLVRNVPRPFDTPPAATRETQQPVPDDLGRTAAKAAAEADGYKRVSVVGRAASGAWRAKGFRGATEVLLTVDGTGRVSAD